MGKFGEKDYKWAENVLHLVRMSLLSQSKGQLYITVFLDFVILMFYREEDGRKDLVLFSFIS